LPKINQNARKLAKRQWYVDNFAWLIFEIFKLKKRNLQIEEKKSSN